jgi:hypothetical protein
LVTTLNPTLKAKEIGLFAKPHEAEQAQPAKARLLVKPSAET